MSQKNNGEYYLSKYTSNTSNSLLETGMRIADTGRQRRKAHKRLEPYPLEPVSLYSECFDRGLRRQINSSSHWSRGIPNTRKILDDMRTISDKVVSQSLSDRTAQSSKGLQFDNYSDSDPNSDFDSDEFNSGRRRKQIAGDLDSNEESDTQANDEAANYNGEQGKDHPKSISKNSSRRLTKNLNLLEVLDPATLDALHRAFTSSPAARTKGLTLPQFVKLVHQLIGNRHDENALSTALCACFSAVDVDSDGYLKWEELSSFIIESGLNTEATPLSTVGTIDMQNNSGAGKQEYSPSGISARLHDAPIERLMYLPETDSLICVRQGLAAFEVLKGRSLEPVFVVNTATSTVSTNYKTQKNLTYGADMSNSLDRSSRLFAPSTTSWDYGSGKIQQLARQREVTAMAGISNYGWFATACKDRTIRLWDARQSFSRVKLDASSAMNAFSASYGGQRGGVGGGSSKIPISSSHLSIANAGYLSSIDWTCRQVQTAMEWDSQNSILYSACTSEISCFQISHLESRRTHGTQSYDSSTCSMSLLGTFGSYVNSSSEMPQSSSSSKALAHTDTVTALKVLPNLGQLVTASMDTHIFVRDPNTGVVLQDLKAHRNGVHTLSYDAPAHLLYSAGFERTAYVWNPFTNRVICSLSSPYTLVSIEAIPDSAQLVTADAGGVIKLWDTRTFGCVQTIYLENERGQRVSQLGAFTCMGRHRRLASGTDRVICHNDSSGAEFDSEAADAGPTVKAVYCADLNSIFTCSGSNVRVWDATHGRQTRVIRGVTNAEIITMTMTPCKKKILLGDSEGVVTVIACVSGAILRRSARQSLPQQTSASLPETSLSQHSLTASHGAVHVKDKMNVTYSTRAIPSAIGSAAAAVTAATTAAALVAINPGSVSLSSLSVVTEESISDGGRVSSPTSNSQLTAGSNPAKIDPNSQSLSPTNEALMANDSRKRGSLIFFRDDESPKAAESPRKNPLAASGGTRKGNAERFSFGDASTSEAAGLLQTRTAFVNLDKVETVSAAASASIQRDRNDVDVALDLGYRVVSEATQQVSESLARLARRASLSQMLLQKADDDRRQKFIARKERLAKLRKAKYEESVRKLQSQSLLKRKEILKCKVRAKLVEDLKLSGHDREPTVQEIMEELHVAMKTAGGSWLPEDEVLESETLASIRISDDEDEDSDDGETTPYGQQSIDQILDDASEKRRDSMGDDSIISSLREKVTLHRRKSQASLSVAVAAAAAAAHESAVGDKSSSDAADNFESVNSTRKQNKVTSEQAFLSSIVNAASEAAAAVANSGEYSLDEDEIILAIEIGGVKSSVIPTTLAVGSSLEVPPLESKADGPSHPHSLTQVSVSPTGSVIPTGLTSVVTSKGWTYLMAHNPATSGTLGQSSSSSSDSGGFVIRKRDRLGPLTAAAASVMFDLQAAANSEGGIILQSLSTHTTVGVLAAHRHEVSTLVFLEPYPILLSADVQGEVLLWAVPPAVEAVGCCLLRLINDAYVPFDSSSLQVPAAHHRPSSMGKRPISTIVEGQQERSIPPPVPVSAATLWLNRPSTLTDTSFDSKSNSSTHSQESVVKTSSVLLLTGDVDGVIKVWDITGAISRWGIVPFDTESLSHSIVWDIKVRHKQLSASQSSSHGASYNPHRQTLSLPSYVTRYQLLAAYAKKYPNPFLREKPFLTGDSSQIQSFGGSRFDVKLLRAWQAHMDVIRDISSIDCCPQVTVVTVYASPGIATAKAAAAGAAFEEEKNLGDVNSGLLSRGYTRVPVVRSSLVSTHVVVSCGLDRAVAIWDEFGNGLGRLEQGRSQRSSDSDRIQQVVDNKRTQTRQGGTMNDIVSRRQGFKWSFRPDVESVQLLRTLEAASVLAQMPSEDLPNSIRASSTSQMVATGSSQLRR